MTDWCIKPERQRALLAVIAAHGILGHNSVSEMPARFSLRRIQELLPQFDDRLLDDLEDLTSLGLLGKRNTSHSGYGGTLVEGYDVWRITPRGLASLWGVELP